MLSLRSGKLSFRFIALFLLMVIFSTVILVGVTGYFFRKSHEALYTRVQDNMETITKRLSSDVLTLFDLCGMLAENSIVQENFRPYGALTLNQKYYYNELINLLWQSRLQFGGLIESVFLYADSERVLYSANENGMTKGDAFFSRIMNYEKMKKEDWLSLLDKKTVGFTVLSPDKYSTVYFNDSRTVIPIAYRFVNHGYSNVLVMNVSLEKIGALYEAYSILEQSFFAVLNAEGNRLYGDERMDIKRVSTDESFAFLRGEKCHVYSTQLQTLNISILCLTPHSALLKVTNGFGYVVFAFLFVFVLCGVMLTVVLSRKMYEPFRIIHETMPQSSGEETFKNELESIKTSITSLAEERQTFFMKSQEHLNHYISQTLANLLASKTLDNEAYFAQTMTSEYGFTSSACRVVDLLFDMPSSSGYLTIHEAMKNFAQIIEEVFSACGSFVRIRFEENMYVLVLAETETDDEHVKHLCQTLSNRVTKLTRMSTSVRYGIGHTVSHYSLLPESFEAANTAVFALPPPEGWQAAPSEEETFHYDQKEIVRALMTCDIRLIEEACAEMLNRAKYCRASYDYMCYVLKDICYTAMTLQKKRSPDCSLPIESLDTLAVLILSPRINTSALIAALLPYIPTLSRESNEGSTERIAKKIKLYIDANYSQELSLDILADQLGLSAKYISRVYKATMNWNLSDYLAYVRVEKAKELLLTTQPLEKIAEQVGITNRTTFTRIFRKLEGMAPSEWRRVNRDHLTIAAQSREESGKTGEKPND